MRIPNPFKLAEATFCAFIYWWRGYEVIVPPHVEEFRLTGPRGCERCPDFDPDIRQCNVCTCFADAKVIVASERCPRRRWGRWKRKRIPCGRRCHPRCR